MGTGQSDSPSDELDVVTLLPIVERVVRARVSDAVVAEDIVQETLVRVLTAADRIEPGMAEPYTIRTARNVLATMWRDQDRERRHRPRLLDPGSPDAPEETLVLGEEHGAVTEALDRLPPEERSTLLAHELHGRDTASLAEELDSTAGAVAARLKRIRARMRVEYLLAVDHVEPPTERCRPVLLALSSGDRRRREEADVDRHLLECATCARLSRPLLARAEPRDGEARVPVGTDSDIVTARQHARGLASRAGFTLTEQTMVATAVTEVARNILRFAGAGEVVLTLVEEDRPGIRVVARDVGPGIPDVDRALAEGYSTDQGLGFGLPGIQQLMDECTVASEPGAGTTVTMTKWRAQP